MIAVATPASEQTRRHWVGTIFLEQPEINTTKAGRAFVLSLVGILARVCGEVPPLGSNTITNRQTQLFRPSPLEIRRGLGRSAHEGIARMRSQGRRSSLRMWPTGPGEEWRWDRRACRLAGGCGADELRRTEHPDLQAVSLLLECSAIDIIFLTALRGVNCTRRFQFTERFQVKCLSCLLNLLSKSSRSPDGDRTLPRSAANPFPKFRSGPDGVQMTCLLSIPCEASVWIEAVLVVPPRAWTILSALCGSSR